MSALALSHPPGLLRRTAHTARNRAQACVWREQRARVALWVAVARACEASASLCSRLGLPRIAHVVMMLVRTSTVQPLSLRPVQPGLQREAAHWYRIAGSQKKIARALGVDQSTVCRVMQAEIASPLARCADELERLEAAGIEATHMRAWLHSRARAARAAYREARRMGRVA